MTDGSGIGPAITVGGCLIAGIILLAAVGGGGAQYAAAGTACGYIPPSASALPLPATDLEAYRSYVEQAAALGAGRDQVVADIAAQLAQRTPPPEDAVKRAGHVVTSVARQVCTELAVVPAGAVAGAGRGAIAVRAALAKVGTPYSWGGGGPGGPTLGIGRGAGTVGFDCSGLTEYAWGKAGLAIGGHTSPQWRSGARIPRSQIQPGDLIFFATNPADPSTIYHVGLALDATRMVHAPHTGSTVRVDTWAGAPGRERSFAGVVRPVAR
ncbi:hypothetical protein DP939_42245 [Spongiactinospora rosea]|uniref:NlpC/P60 domain-containing protein n=1 Tax=Spongiactinospora rosea TaxID=2248750 RepID=A0A366LL06_9ACTN|nr:C40 family peptidase [Spongiactinospora rosea]RBQ14173.1 hypothetical protein DP939_42245 [Spongiactinospora rosea]